MKIIWTKLALADVQCLWDYIAEENATAADDMLGRIEKAVGSLAIYPHLGRPGRVKGTRELVILGTPYIIPYRAKRNSVEVIAVIHGSRRWPESF